MIRKSFGSRLFDGLNYVFMALLVFLTLYPLYYLLVVSLSDGVAASKGIVYFWPSGTNIEAYKLLLGDKSIIRAYGNTLLYTSVGTAVNMMMTILCAYPLSKKEFYGRSGFTVMIVITMFFSGGLIPSYLLINQLGLLNSMWAVILPGVVSAWNMFIMRTSFQGIPGEIFESAKIDGANEWLTLLRIVLPVSVPMMATIAMFYAVGHWNSYFPALIYLNEKAKFPLQILLRSLVVEGDMAAQAQELSGAGAITTLNIKYAIIIIAILPILLVYPFIQKYFVKGIMIGSLKG
ncbi:carbohydrate ABC transporter permease [Paenibacillus thalictri]|uniref:Carbohydrate ABC transporter permease n=1 Tax=Paenibacillus thalictri TaxID=2527873 RepID=A0A4V2J4F5_9BACL|nr:carbohydrate ABC transporter permease [Paenibacillus thalictri]TBL79562.1 carbohydrate ABC transporter permease [Paenibacillus thalictri]